MPEDTHQDDPETEPASGRPLRTVVAASFGPLEAAWESIITPTRIGLGFTFNPTTSQHDGDTAVHEDDRGTTIEIEDTDSSPGTTRE